MLTAFQFDFKLINENLKIKFIEIVKKVNQREKNSSLFNSIPNPNYSIFLF